MITPVRVVMLNGGSSSGKTTLGRKLQVALDGVWLLVGVDLYLWMLPETIFEEPDGFSIVDGAVQSGPATKRLFTSFQYAVAALAKNGADIIIDEVMLDGGDDQRRWEAALDGLDVCWVGVRCAADVAEARERARGDRQSGMARLQAESVHRGMRYDLEVDTGVQDTAGAVDVVAAALGTRWSLGNSPATAGPPAHPTVSGWRDPAPW